MKLWIVGILLIVSYISFAIKKPLVKTIQDNSIDFIYASKSAHKMYVFNHKKLIKTYDIGIGGNAIGHKLQKGDNRTPEGVYFINGKNANSDYYKNLSISYPNEKDRKDCLKRKVETGGDIKIHGYKDAHGSTTDRFTKYAYTWGCISVCNKDMDELYKWVKIGAIIKIVP